jgi:hypothetical protein
MALPKLDVPTYELTLPLSNKKVKYRPFTVKEQRNLLMAMEANDSETIQQSIGDILNNCNLTEGIEIDKLPIIDVEYYFINLRAKSVGEVVDARYRCNNEVDGKNCNNIMETQVDLTKINVERPNDISNEIQLTDKFVIKLKYPEFSSVKSAIKFEDVNTLTFNVIAQSVEYIYDGEQFYYANEVPQKEMVEFIENLSQDQFAKIEVFFENLPKIRQKIDLKCKKCGFEHHLNVEGLENFFG